MAPSGGEIYFCFIETSPNFLIYNMQKKYLDIFNILGVVRYKSLEVT